MPSSRGSSQPRGQTQVSCIVGDALPSEPPEKPTEKANLILFTYCAIKSEIKSFIYSFILLILL